MKKQKKLLVISIALFLLSFIIVKFSEQNTHLVTEFYSFGFYKYYITFLSKVNTLVPFSIAEVLLVCFGIFIVIYVILLIKTIISNRKKLFSVIMLAVFPASLITFMFTISFLPNYHRYNFVEYTDLVITETSSENLYLLCEKLVQDANEYREQLNQDGEVFSYDIELNNSELFQICTNSYTIFLESYPKYEQLFSTIQYAKAKPVILSEVMSYLQITGFFFGLTGEANINTHSSDVYIPATVCHELAHVAGFMSEDEANFISYLVCRSSDNKMLNYSGTMLALLHSTNALYSVDLEKHIQISSMISEDVMRDIEAHNEYYYSYDTSIGDFSSTVNDSYLKANNQSDGIKSYGKMVDLLIADFNKGQE